MSTENELSGFDIPSDFSMPTMAEIEEILALGDRSWTSLLAAPEKAPRRRRGSIRRVAGGAPSDDERAGSGK